jgi:hypothetical protein
MEILRLAKVEKTGGGLFGVSVSKAINRFGAFLSVFISSCAAKLLAVTTITGSSLRRNIKMNSL